MEDDLLDKMKDLIPLMFKPFEVLKAIQVINQAKRRGASSPDAITAQQTVVQLIMPTQIFNSFTKQDLTLNINNQVIKAGQQDLITVQSGAMDKLLSASRTSPALTHSP